MVDWQNAGRIAGHTLNIGANILGAGLDYASGKAEGEDDFRAGAGAVASGLGGWKGALAGAGAGSAFGPAGALAGGVIGGIAGSFAGGWTADRADEFVRGKNTGIRNNTGARNNMSQAVQLDNGDVAQVDNNGNIVGWLVKGGVVLAGGNAIYNIGKEIAQNPINPGQAYQGFQQVYNTINPSGIGQVNNIAAAQSAAGEVGKQLRANVGQGLRNTGNNIGRVWNAIPGSNAVKGGAGLVLVGDQLTGGNLAKGVGRVLGGGADMIANAVGFKTDFDGQNQMSQQAMKEDREQQRIEQNRGIQNPYDDEMYKRYRMMSEDARNREDAVWNRNKDEAWRVADKADEVSRRNFLTNFTANQANALLQGYMTDIPRSVNDSLRTVFSARYN